jgi:hypothetical protein
MRQQPAGVCGSAALGCSLQGVLASGDDDSLGVEAAKDGRGRYLERGRVVYEEFRTQAAQYLLVVGELKPWDELPLATRESWAITADVVQRRRERKR